MDIVKKILVVVDGSPQVNVAIGHLVDLAPRPEKCEAVLLIVTPPLSDWQQRSEKAREETDANEQQARQGLGLTWQRLDRAGLYYKTRIVAGEFASTVARVCRDEGCDLIIIAQQPMGALARTIMAMTGLCVGTVVDKVMALAPMSQLPSSRAKGTDDWRLIIQKYIARQRRPLDDSAAFLSRFPIAVLE